MTSKFYDKTASSISFDRVFFLLSRLVTGTSFMPASSLVLELWIFLETGFRLTRNSEIGNTPFWVLPNICRLGRVRHIKFGTNISKKCNWMLRNTRVTSVTVLELLKENEYWLGDGEGGGAGGWRALSETQHIQRCIWSSVNHLKRSVLQKRLTAKSRQLFTQNTQILRVREESEYVSVYVLITFY